MSTMKSMTQAERIQKFVDEIWQWYVRHKRTLPWRDLKIKDDTERAYRILVSEIMLQQTQVPRVMVIYKRFLREFPTLRDLADASNKEVIMAWRGMGYNSRALRLRDAARSIVTGYWLAGYSLGEKKRKMNQLTSNKLTKLSFPSDYDELLSIPGIGPYTAAAIRNFAFNIPTPCIDTNIRRILHRTFVGPEDGEGKWRMNDKELMDIAEKVLKVALDVNRYRIQDIGRKSYHLRLESHVSSTADWHAALMDFGSMVQTKSNPKWNICPLTEKGIMRTTPKNFPKFDLRNPKSQSSEPGREMGGRFIPNRIFRGRIVEALRDAQRGMTFDKIGQEICIDWSKDHELWLKNMITKLVQDGFVAERDSVYQLRD